MKYLLDVNAETNLLKYLGFHPYGIETRISANYLPWGVILNSKQEVPAPFISDGNAVLEEFLAIVLSLGFLEF